MPRLSPPLIQGTGKDGSFAGAVYITDGQLITYRWIPNPKTLEEVKVKLRAAGLSDKIEGADNLAAFGVLVGPTPASR